MMTPAVTVGHRDGKKEFTGTCSVNHLFFSFYPGCFKTNLRTQIFSPKHAQNIITGTLQHKLLKVIEPLHAMGSGHSMRTV